MRDVLGDKFDKMMVTASYQPLRKSLIISIMYGEDEPPTRVQGSKIRNFPRAGFFSCSLCRSKRCHACFLIEGCFGARFASRSLTKPTAGISEVGTRLDGWPTGNQYLKTFQPLH